MQIVRINNYVHQEALGANMMIAMPISATDAPTMSQKVGLIPSTAHNQKMATKMYMPPYAA